MLWKATVADTTPNEWPSVIEEALLLVEQMNLTFDSVGRRPIHRLDGHLHAHDDQQLTTGNGQLRLGRVHAQRDQDVALQDRIYPRQAHPLPRCVVLSDVLNYISDLQGQFTKQW